MAFDCLACGGVVVAAAVGVGHDPVVSCDSAGHAARVSGPRHPLARGVTSAAVSRVSLARVWQTWSAHSCAPSCRNKVRAWWGAVQHNEK